MAKVSVEGAVLALNTKCTFASTFPCVISHNIIRHRGAGLAGDAHFCAGMASRV